MQKLEVRQEQADKSVAVVIPVYNGAHFVSKAIESVLAQTLPAAEILVINDGSTDNIAEVMGRYPAPVRLISKPNGGLSSARNAGIQAARSRYVAFLDADDWWDPRKLERQVAAMESDGADANYTGWTNVDAATGGEQVIVPATPQQVERAVLWCNPGGPTGSSILVKREMLERVGPFNEKLPACEDWDMWFRLSRAGAKFSVTPEPLTYILVSPKGMSGNAEHMYKTFLLLLDDLLVKDMRGVRRMMWRRRILAYQSYLAVLTARAAGRSDLERAYMWKSILAWPSPFWTAKRFKVFAVTMLRSRGRGMKPAL